MSEYKKILKDIRKQRFYFIQNINNEEFITEDSRKLKKGFEVKLIFKDSFNKKLL